MSEPHSSSKPRIKPWTIWIPVIIMALGLVVFYNYLLYTKGQLEGDKKDRPPYIHKAEDDLILTERSGKEVRMSELRGKILLVSWVFTRCPRGCAGVVTKLKALHGEYAGRDDIHFVSFSLDPEDTPEMLKSFAEGAGISEDAPWWFVSGDMPKIRDFMVRQLRFRPVQTMPEADRLTPDDKFIHDLRVCLVDNEGNVRRLADVMNADPEYADFWDAQLRKDIDYLLAEKDKTEPK